jgi:hypothetical protein
MDGKWGNQLWLGRVTRKKAEVSLWQHIPRLCNPVMSHRSKAIAYGSLSTHTNSPDRSILTPDF